MGVASGLRAVRDADLSVDVRKMELDRLFGDPQAASDLCVRTALGDEAENLDLALREGDRQRDA